MGEIRRNNEVILDYKILKTSENTYDIIEIYNNHRWKFSGMIIFDEKENKYNVIKNEKILFKCDSTDECLAMFRKV
jgi:hypothetical protein